MPLPQLVAAFACNVCVALLNALAISRLLHGPSSLGSLRNASLYLLTVVVANPAAVALGAAFEPILGGADPAAYWAFWWRWYLSNALAGLTLTPIFLTWWWDSIGRPIRLPSRRRLLEAGALALLLMGSCTIAFATPATVTTTDLIPALLYLPLPLLLAAAVRFGGKGVSGAILIIALMILLRAMHGDDLFGGSPPAHSVQSVQLFLAVIGIPMIMLSALVEELRQAVTERRAAELDAASTRDLLQSSLDALTAQIAILGHDGTIIAANRAWQEAAEQLARFDEHYVVGVNFLDECERGRPRQQAIAAGLRRVVAGELSEFRLEYASDVAEGVWLQMRGTRFGDASELRLVVANEDITEVKASERALRRLTGQLLHVQDEERRRIARDLHDSTAQNLLAATLGIGQAVRLAPRLNQAARAALDESRSLIDQSQREIRTVSYLLHPPMLDEAGLPAAIRWFCSGFAKRTGISVNLDISSEINRLPAAIEAALFRIAQEALTNVHRHSGSPTVQIALTRERQLGPMAPVVLVISDQGKGMPRVRASARGACSLGIGVAGMQERMHQLGGHLDISSSRQGTIVRASIAVTEDAGAPVRGNLSIAD